MKLPVIKTILLTAITWQSPLANAQILISEVGAAPPRKEAKSEPKRKAAKKKAAKLAPGVLAPMNPESVTFEVKAAPSKLSLKKGDTIVLLGSGMASRMNHFGYFETEIQLRFPTSNLTIRNMGDEGNTPGFRPHPGRNQEGQYAFPGAKELLPTELQAGSRPQGHFETPDQWLTSLGADTIIPFFGYNSSFEGPNGVDRYKAELTAFVQHTLSQKYNGKNIPQLALVSPTAMQDLSGEFSVPDGKEGNQNLKLYAAAMKEVANANGALFVDAFATSAQWFAVSDERLTIDGALLNDDGYRKLTPWLADALFSGETPNQSMHDEVHAAVQEKNFMWLNDFKVPNGVHVYGRRYNPYGPANYPFELKKTREFTQIRDQAIWATLKGEKFDVAGEDAKTSKLPPV